ncbi:NmrA-like family-domain-containing protein [Stachybotrys elegans]|uniref:NmrA-like family-domain-containing protein n=1 Tax=Stachybotrys elegans TaxID=80388 RepID=A0A8K0SNK9_9HYPO|nr:NmrA-like family-domain-containing protein [Stachybotrys elegans]
MSSVIVSGAGGNFGSFILEALVNQKHKFSRIAILCSQERKSNFVQWETKGFELIVGSPTDSTSFQGFDVAISLLGNLGLRLQPKMVDAAIAAGVKHFYPSEFGNDIDQTELRNARYYTDKVLTRQHLREKAKEYPSFVYTLVHIGLFAETFALSEEFGVNRTNKTFTWFGNPETEASFSSMADTARYTIESILLPLGGKQERKLNVPNGNFKIEEVIETLGQVQGINYTPVYKPPQETVDEEERQRKGGNVGLELLASVRRIIGQPQSAVPKPWNHDDFQFSPIGLKAMFEATLDGEAMKSSSLK